MDITLHTPMKGTLVLCDVSTVSPYLPASGFYTFLWVRKGTFTLDVDHIPVELGAGCVLPLSPMHRVDALHGDGECMALMFDSNFYCIFGHDNEVSCNGFLFNGTTDVMRLQLGDADSTALQKVVDAMCEEYGVPDSFREEMLRMQLKRFIILCTRIARERFGGTALAEPEFDIVRRFYVLLDTHFREKKRVQDYAELLHRSPKTLTNLFAACGRPSPLRVIHERVNAEARRLALYTAKSAKEIAYLLGFEDTATFSRFFTKMNGRSITDYRRSEKKEE